jgi:hypothetical protein
MGECNKQSEAEELKHLREENAKLKAELQVFRDEKK